MEPLLSRNTKKKRRSSSCPEFRIDYSKCIICQSAAKKHGKTSTITSKGLPGLKSAIFIRKDELFAKIWSDLEDEATFLEKRPIVHVICRSKYTLKRTLDNIKLRSKQTKGEKSDSLDNSTIRLRSDSSSLVGKSLEYNKSVCFLCEKERDSYGVWTLIAIATPDGRERAIHKKAKDINDEVMLFKIKGHGETCVDMVANNFHYHRSCMSRYMNKRTLNDKELSSNSNQHDAVFSLLVSEISDGLRNERHVYSVDQIVMRYNDLLAEHGKTECRPDRLVKRIVNHFTADLVQTVKLKGRSLVCPTSLTVKELCSQVFELKSNLNESNFLSSSDNESENEKCNTSMNSYLVAKNIRAELKQVSRDTEMSEIEVSCSATSSLVPVNLYNHLAWLLFDTSDSMDEDGRVDLLDEQKKRVMSLGNDILSLVNKQPTSKQVGLALHILKETRNKNLITMTNRLGHCISYSSAQRYVTTIANKVLEKEEVEGIYIPENIVHGCFLQTALDNLNFHSETEDGGSLDATTNIIYQYSSGNDTTDTFRRVPYDPKNRKTTIEIPDKFHSVKSHLTLKDRKEARALNCVKLDDIAKVSERQDLSDVNIVLFLLRMFPTTLLITDGDYDSAFHNTPTWNSFFSLYSGNDKPKTEIGYGPLYPQTPTDPDVVKTSLDYFVTLTNKLNQTKTVVTCDQAIYDIIKGLVKKNPVRYKDVILRLGGFHIIQNFMGSIGFLMKESGIEDLLVTAEICHRGTANKVMAGKDYYKMIRYHSWLCEAFFMLKWEAFEQWLLEKETVGHVESISHITELLQDIGNDFEAQDKDNLRKHVDRVLDNLSTLLNVWEEFENSFGETAKFWDMYIDMVLIFKRYVNAERAGLWEQHLIEARNMLPYIVASGHTKYMSCLPIYLEEMMNLPTTAPEVQVEFEAGNFAVHQKHGSFNGVWTDLALEQTYNKEGKNNLFKGITQKETAREKYIKALPTLTAVSESMKQMVHLQSVTSDHHEKISKDDLQKILKIRNTVFEDMRNPFSSNVESEQLVNISTGEILITSEVVRSKQLGLDAIVEARTSGAAKIISPKILTFALQKKKMKNKQDPVKMIASEESIVTRALCFTQDLTEEGKIEAFSFEWCNYPPSLFEPSKHDKDAYKMRKGNKVDFLETIRTKLNGTWSPLSELPPSISKPVYLIDAMAFIHRFQTLGAIVFRQLPELYKNKILRIKPANCCEIHFVADRYDFGEMSLKSDERLRRQEDLAMVEYEPTDNMKIPQWKAFTSNPKNKQNLLKYIASCWSTCHLPEGISLIFDIEDQHISVTNKDTTPLERYNNHEEADTRIFAHIANCSESNSFVIHATDTDIIALAMFHSQRLSHVLELWVEKNDTYLPIHDLVNQLAENLEKEKLVLTGTLLASYVLSGCDSVSYPFGRGKKRSTNVALQMIGKMNHIVDFSHNDSHVSSTVFDEARDFFCCLYGKPEYSFSLDRLRAHLFTSTKRDLRLLPPTEDAFHQHVLRSLCQFSLYKEAAKSNPCLLSPLKFGRKLDQKGALVPVMMTKESKMAAAKLLFCKCKKGCLQKCSCAKNGTACIIACSCNGHHLKCGRLEEDSEEDDMTF